MKRKKDLIDKTKKIDKSRSSVKLRGSLTKAHKRKSASRSNKGSRQSAYEMGDGDQINFKLRERISVFEAPSAPKSKKDSIKSEDRLHLEQLKIQANQALDESERKENDNNDPDESHAPLVIQENPNMPDGDILPNPRMYEGIDEESEGFKSQSEESLEKSSLQRRKKTNSISSSENGLAPVKASKKRYEWMKLLFSPMTKKLGYHIILVLFVLYNMIFIPLQGGYRIEYGPYFIIMEILTVSLYSFDVYCLVLSHKEISIKLKNQVIEDFETDRNFQDSNLLRKQLRKIKFLIVVTIISIIPFAIFFEL